MRIRIRIAQVLTLVALLAIGSLATALTAQYLFDMQPCPWCVLQRLIYIVVAVLALAGAFLRGRARQIAIALAFIGTLSGIASALWQHLVASHEDSCVLSLADRITTGLHLDRLMPKVFIAFGGCDQLKPMMGIPFAIWSCAMYVILALLLAWTLRATMKSARSPY
jgi:disulfide bond formation protein DsbB